MQDRNNTIAGWILFAGIIALGSTLLIGEIFHKEEFANCPTEEGEPLRGFGSEEICNAVVASADEEAEQPIAFYLATADASRGEDLFRSCTNCHNAVQGGAHAAGPNLYGIMGADIGSKPGYSYSSALSEEPGVWDWEKMSAWLANPRLAISGNKMSYPGMSSPEDRAALMLWLNQQGSGIAVPPPPAVEEAPAEEGGEAATEESAEEEGAVEETEEVVEETADAA
ncbi:c-type cytochrome [Sphingomicrobium sediminis]|uniref:C-type cytochrome n=1 Tax=Sphingomicrobium sediminis TaxID=2950949 RepID=A0A9X2J347_9SPHN|nr:c-type cytochrome [Sphingomicrobium sediminis]MCM8557710.1 c-type cytochrome [Sphingomicrobium sediminis]